LSGVLFFVDAIFKTDSMSLTDQPTKGESMSRTTTKTTPRTVRQAQTAAHRILRLYGNCEYRMEKAATRYFENNRFEPGALDRFNTILERGW
jgi:hypothetical protein